ncbi:growth-regulated alpha protein-like [Poecilia reticulata]|uniref:growth-regulated alpha protein-like n=1 Tax=Poecilia reticulata TaxID=8081 RepID=UPI0007EA10E5|nr:PREDICTED: growth-regulated alpha protein-like [Poecilia reticulata]
MNSGIQCIVLLACIAVCSSASIMRCQCIKTISAVRPHLIADVRVHQPGPYCSKQEVIVILKDETQRCLDPEGRQAQDIIRSLLKAKEMQTKAEKTSRVNTKATTAAAATTAATTTTATSVEATAVEATAAPTAAAATTAADKG